MSHTHSYLKGNSCINVHEIYKSILVRWVLNSAVQNAKVRKAAKSFLTFAFWTAESKNHRTLFMQDPPNTVQNTLTS